MSFFGQLFVGAMATTRVVATDTCPLSNISILDQVLGNDDLLYL